MGNVEKWWNNFPKIAPLFQSSTGLPSVGGEAELEVLVEKGRWCCWWWWRCWSEVGGGKEVEAEIAETYLCTYSCRWCEKVKGPKMSNMEKLQVQTFV